MVDLIVPFLGSLHLQRQMIFNVGFNRNGFSHWVVALRWIGSDSVTNDLVLRSSMMEIDCLLWSVGVNDNKVRTSNVCSEQLGA